MKVIFLLIVSFSIITPAQIHIGNGTDYGSEITYVGYDLDIADGICKSPRDWVRSCIRYTRPVCRFAAQYTYDLDLIICIGF